MSLEADLADVFQKNEWTWSVKSKAGSIIPDEDDITAALDEAARVLYDVPVGAQLEIGHLIIVKKSLGHDVYVYAGDYI